MQGRCRMWVVLWVDMWKVSKLQSKIRVCMLWWKETHRVRVGVLLQEGSCCGLLYDDML